MQKLRYLLITALCAVLLPLTAGAHEFKSGDLLIGHPWARATPGQLANGAAYLTVTNSGKETERLVSAETPVAAKAELHVHLMEDGVMKMRPVDGVDIVPGTPIELKPSGLHIMLLNLKAPLKEGDLFPLTLTFQKSGPVTVSVLVEGVAASHSEHEGHMAH
jgi:copper(I)-binding protein